MESDERAAKVGTQRTKLVGVAIFTALLISTNNRLLNRFLLFLDKQITYVDSKRYGRDALKPFSQDNRSDNRSDFL